jgi:peroxiredoxin Q/BCP
MRLQTGKPAPEFTLTDIHGQEVSLAALRGKRVMLSFYRYASCPFCNLRIHELSKRAEGYRQRGLELIAVFQSPGEKILQYAGKQQPPFAIIPDPQRLLYRRYGVESSWSGMLRAFAIRLPEVVKAIASGFLPGSVEGDVHRVPADFIVDEEGKLLATFYGKDIGDHLPLDTLENYLMKQ